MVQAIEDSPHRLCDPSPRTRAGLPAHRAPPLQLPGLMHVAAHSAQRRLQIPSPPSPLFASLPRPVQRISTEASFRRWEKSTHLGDHLLGRPGPALRKAMTPLPHCHSPAQAQLSGPAPSSPASKCAARGHALQRGVGWQRRPSLHSHRGSFSPHASAPQRLPDSPWPCRSQGPTVSLAASLLPLHGLLPFSLRNFHHPENSYLALPVPPARTSF